MVPFRVSSRRRPGALALVLHTHMPYVEGGGRWPPSGKYTDWPNREGFGTWPFGEEWLWEAIASSYLPLLDVLGRAPLTLSLTPVLCDQLEAPDAVARCLRFLGEVRPESHRRDIEELRRSGQQDLAAELERSAREYAQAAERLEGIGEQLLGRLGEHSRWTSAATHGVLPLVSTDAGLELQVQTGTASHRRRFGEWSGGFWLPECAHAQWLNPLLAQEGVRSTCVELTGLFGIGDPRHLVPMTTDDGPVLWLLDRQIVSLVWGDRGYPAAGAYRDYHRHTTHHHRVWRNDGGPYDFREARALAEEHARDFVDRVCARVQAGGVCVCALDTELLGHWWYEGVHWLQAVLDESARQGLRLTALDDALDRHEPTPAPAELPVTSWGTGGDLRTWSAPPVADLAWLLRTAELKLLAGPARPSSRAVRELLALQASDWAFLAYRELAGEYPRERAREHAQALERALAGEAGLEPRLRNLAPELAGFVG
jgi:1,4-alpha-glucan branching enzyme